MTALRRASGGSYSPVGSEAAGNFAFLAEVLEKRLLRVRGWKSAMLAWRAAASAGRSRGGCRSFGQSGEGRQQRAFWPLRAHQLLSSRIEAVVGPAAPGAGRRCGPRFVNRI